MAVVLGVLLVPVIGNVREAAAVADQWLPVAVGVGFVAGVAAGPIVRDLRRVSVTKQ